MDDIRKAAERTDSRLTTLNNILIQLLQELAILQNSDPTVSCNPNKKEHFTNTPADYDFSAGERWVVYVNVMGANKEML